MTPEQRAYLIEYMSRIYLCSAGNDREEIAQIYTGSRLDPKTGMTYKSFQEILDVMPEGKFDEMMVENGIAELVSSGRGMKKNK